MKDERADPVARRLAALALDDRHSEADDAMIKAVSITCEDKGLQTLCIALQGSSGNWKVLGSPK